MGKRFTVRRYRCRLKSVNQDYQRFQDVPTVLVYKGEAEVAAERGCILCYHGLGSSKDAWLHDLREIAARGFLVVAVDNAGHGERRYSDFEARFSAEGLHYWQAFTAVVRETAAELPALLNELLRRHLAVPGKVGALGVSLGGFIAYRAVTTESRLTAVATLVSSPEWWGLESPESPHHDLEAFAEVRLLSLTAGQDNVVPNSYTFAFYERLRERYEDYQVRFKHVDYGASTHLLEPDWPVAWEETIAWFERFLSLQ